MIKTLTVFLALSFLCCLATNEDPDTKNLRLLRSTDPPSISSVDLTTTGYQVFVDFSSNIKLGRAMLLALYTSETVFVNNQLNGAKFECGALGSQCSRIVLGNFGTLTTPYLKVDGERMMQSVFLDHNHWYIKPDYSYMPMVLNSYGGHYDARGTFGFIGMGRKKSSTGNRFFSEIFSIYLENDRKGLLLFGNDLNFAQFNTPQVSLPATEDWHITNFEGIDIKSKTTVKNIRFPFHYKILLDTNEDNILLHSGFIKPLMQILKDLLPSCKNTESSLICAFNGDFSSLPTIELLIEGGAKLKIPPEGYAFSSTEGEVSFRIFSHKPFTESTEFQYTIILGSKFMQHYYTVFDGLNEKIHFYTAKNRRDLYETRVDPIPSDNKDDSETPPPSDKKEDSENPTPSDKKEDSVNPTPSEKKDESLNSGPLDNKGSSSKDDVSSNTILMGGIGIIIILLIINAYLTKKKSKNELSYPIMPYPHLNQNPFTNYHHPQQMSQNFYHNQPGANFNSNSQQNPKENIETRKEQAINPSVPSSKQVTTELQYL